MRWTVSVLGREAPVIADDDGPDTVVVLAHGAGSHMEHKTMEWLAALARRSGCRVVRFNFLYRAEGKGMPDRMPILIETYRAVADSVREKLAPKRLVIGGHSMGGRTASMLESEGGQADGLLLFSYPLHPPEQPEKLRDAHIPKVGTPTLQFSGTEDSFCRRDLMEKVDLPQRWTLHWLDGADHGYGVKRTSGRSKKDLEEEIVSALTSWLDRL